MDDTIDYLASHGTKYGMLWIDVEGTDVSYLSLPFDVSITRNI